MCRTLYAVQPMGPGLQTPAIGHLECGPPSEQGMAITLICPPVRPLPQQSPANPKSEVEIMGDLGPEVGIWDLQTTQRPSVTAQITLIIYG